MGVKRCTLLAARGDTLVRGRYGGSMSTPATVERHALCDLMLQVGPDAATLCEGWTTRDLAAHMILRERRPDGAPGVVLKPFAGYTDKVQSKIADKPWDEVVRRLRSGPPRWSPARLDAVDRRTNTVEFFVHHEDVRRAQPDWTPRELTDDLRADLVTALGFFSKLLSRKLPVGLTLAPTDVGETIRAKKGEPSATMSGPIGEIVLYLYGRDDHADVELTGPEEAVEAIRSASFGF